jgi:hypothetical protein
VNEFPIAGQRLAVVDFDSTGLYENTARLTDNPYEANLITSLVSQRDPNAESLHKVVVDVDRMPVKALESSTPGNYHLYIDKAMRWPTYTKLLNVLEEAEIIETGYLNATLARGYSTLRLPWVKK